MIYKPAAGMAMLGAIDHRRRPPPLRADATVVEALRRRPAAILFADLEGSSPARPAPLDRQLFRARTTPRPRRRPLRDRRGRLGRPSRRRRCRGVLPRRDRRDRSPPRRAPASRRARAREARSVDVAARSELQPEDVVLRFGLHWGSTLYVGNITTAGRAEVTALGDEVNEAARIEACATGGLALASKDLVERLEPDDAAALDLDPDHVTYTPLGDLAPRPRRPAATPRPSPSARSNAAARRPSSIESGRRRPRSCFRLKAAVLLCLKARARARLGDSPGALRPGGEWRAKYFHALGFARDARERVDAALVRRELRVAEEEPLESDVGGG